MHARINLTRRDQLSALTRSLDFMADAISWVIQVKQSLALAQERKRLARDLHGSAKQRAFPLNLHLSAGRESVAQSSRTEQMIDAALTLLGG